MLNKKLKEQSYTCYTTYNNYNKITQPILHKLEKIFSTHHKISLSMDVSLEKDKPLLLILLITKTIPQNDLISLIRLYIHTNSYTLHNLSNTQMSSFNNPSIFKQIETIINSKEKVDSILNTLKPLYTTYIKYLVHSIYKNHLLSKIKTYTDLINTLKPNDILVYYNIPYIIGHATHHSIPLQPLNIKPSPTLLDISSFSIKKKDYYIPLSWITELCSTNKTRNLYIFNKTTYSKLFLLKNL